MKNRALRRHQAKRVIKKRLKVIKNAASAPSKMIEQPHRMAKKHPFDCGVPGCPACHMDKVLKKPKISDLRKIERITPERVIKKKINLTNQFIDLDDFEKGIK